MIDIISYHSQFEPILHRYAGCFQYEDDYYMILGDFLSSYYIEARAVFIYKIYADKTNLYIFKPYDEWFSCYDFVKIVAEAQPLSLEDAQKAFPNNGFTEENYGF